MNAAGRYAAQALCYGAFFAAVGYFSSEPSYRQLAAGEALIRLTVSHAAQPREPCRKRTAEELARLAPNMRAPLECPRARAPLAIELEIDGALAERALVPPSGLAADGPATLYRRIVVPAGRREVQARLSDNAEGRFDYTAARSVELAAGRVLTIDFNARAGGFAFR